MGKGRPETRSSKICMVLGGVALGCVEEGLEEGENSEFSALTVAIGFDRGV